MKSIEAKGICRTAATPLSEPARRSRGTPTPSVVNGSTAVRPGGWPERGYRPARAASVGPSPSGGHLSAISYRRSIVLPALPSSSTRGTVSAGSCNEYTKAIGDRATNSPELEALGQAAHVRRESFVHPVRRRRPLRDSPGVPADNCKATGSGGGDQDRAVTRTTAITKTRSSRAAARKATNEQAQPLGDPPRPSRAHSQNWVVMQQARPLCPHPFCPHQLAFTPSIRSNRPRLPPHWQESDTPDRQLTRAARVQHGPARHTSAERRQRVRQSR